MSTIRVPGGSRSPTHVTSSHFLSPHPRTWVTRRRTLAHGGTKVSPHSPYLTRRDSEFLTGPFTYVSPVDPRFTRGEP